MKVMNRRGVQNSSWSPCAASSISSSSGGANPSWKRRLKSVYDIIIAVIIFVFHGFQL